MASGPSASRAMRLCSGVTRYGWAPAVRVRASSSIFGPERGEHPVVGGERRIGSVEPVEEGVHLGQRLAGTRRLP